LRASFPNFERRNFSAAKNGGREIGQDCPQTPHPKMLSICANLVGMTAPAEGIGGSGANDPSAKKSG
jgi:hypothetical protein